MEDKQDTIVYDEKTKLNKDLFKALAEHLGHEIEIVDTTNHGDHVSEYELMCKTCDHAIMRSYNPDGDHE